MWKEYDSNRIHLYLVAICFSSSVEPETLLVYAARFFAMCPMSESHSPENSPNAPITSRRRWQGMSRERVGDE